MPDPLQARVRVAQARMAELCALRRPLNDDEIDEMLRLKKGEQARARMRRRHAESRT